MNQKLSTWLYATRPHTLGASIAPMLILLGAMVSDGVMHWGYYIPCLVVALFSQISSNLANDYFGYKNGEDTDQRVGFTRLLTSGSVTQKEMIIALLISISITALSGLLIAYLRGWWVLLLGAIILLAAIGYSAGKYSLSRTALGDLAVVVFYGLVPIIASYIVVANQKPQMYLLLLALGIGVWETNILVCNNYRDYDEDINSDKQTLVVRMGQKSGPILYLINAIVSLLLLIGGLLIEGSLIGAIVLSLLGIVLYTNAVFAIRRLKGRSLNKLLRYTNLTTLIMGVTTMLALLF